jgi:hypothetical protein
MARAYESTAAMASIRFEELKRRGESALRAIGPQREAPACLREIKHEHLRRLLGFEFKPLLGRQGGRIAGPERLAIHRDFALGDVNPRPTAIFE